MKHDSTMDEQIRSARKKFVAMAATYFLGVFNDNFYKQAVLLLAVAAGLNALQGRATEYFSLPFILFSAYGGWLADRFTKRRVVIGAKFLELAAMLVGAWGILALNWNAVLAMVFLMGLQSTLFGPALNGSIPELYPEAYVTRANAVLKLVTTGAILLGIAMAGLALDQQWMETAIPFGRVLVAILVVLVALLGVMTSFGVHQRPAVADHPPFPWAGPLTSLRDTLRLKSDPALLLAVGCDMFFYFTSLLVVLIINALGISELGLSKSATSLLNVALMVGVCAGSLMAARVSTARRWTHVLVPGTAGMGLCLLLTALIAALNEPLAFALLLFNFSLAGFFGGLFLIPVASFIQVRPPADSKGRVIAVSNFCSFSAMWLSGRIFALIGDGQAPSLFMGGVGAFCLLAALVFFLTLAGLRRAKRINEKGEVV